MRIKITITNLSLLVGLLLCLQIKVCAAPIDEWQKHMTQGSHNKFDGQYNIALQDFTKALNLAEQQKLPAKCLPISWCRVADVEVLTNKIDEADTQFKKIIDYLSQEPTVDPQVSFWAAVLSDSYLGNNKPENREKCIKRACYLKEVIYGDSHRECLDCMNKLAGYYIDQGKVDKAIHILTLTQGVLDKKHGKNPDGLGTTLHQLALNCRKEHKYKQAEELELAVIKIANQSSTNLHVALPAFYLFLGMDEFAQGKIPEGQKYFSLAKRESLKVKSKKSKDLLRPYFDALRQPAINDFYEAKFELAEAEFRQLLAVNETIFENPKDQYGILTFLASVLSVHHPQNCLVYLKRCIAIAENPKSSVHSDLSGLYMRLGMTLIILNEIDEGNKDMVKALSLEKDKNGFHAGVYWADWGYHLMQKHQLFQATEKLNEALKIASALPPEKRGSLMADTYKMIAMIEASRGRQKQAEAALREYEIEAQLQKKINSHLGPNIIK